MLSYVQVIPVSQKLKSYCFEHLVSDIFLLLTLYDANKSWNLQFKPSVCKGRPVQKGAKAACFRQHVLRGCPRAQFTINKNYLENVTTTIGPL